MNAEGVIGDSLISSIDIDDALGEWGIPKNN